MNKITLNDFLTQSIKEKQTTSVVDDNGNDTIITHAFFILDMTEVQVDITCETTGADFSGNDPQNWNYGSKEWDYDIHFFIDGDIIASENSGIILPENWVAEVVREARKMLN